jgi:integrase
MEIHDKVEGARTIPLTPYLSTLLSALPRENEWVFSSKTSASGRIVAPTKAHQSALRTAGLAHISIHGLRRSFITLADWLNPPSGLVAQLVGHKPSAVAEKFYKRRSIDFLREWHVKIEAWMLTEAGIEWNKSN